MAREGAGAARAPGDLARELAIEVDRLRPALAATSWQSTMGDASASLTGYAEGDSLRLVREVLDQGDHGRSAARYYFVGAQLRYYEREGDVVGEGSPTSEKAERAERAERAEMAKEKVVLAFDEQGATVELARVVDGATAPLDGARIEGVQARATELVRQWVAARGAAPR